MIGESPTRTLDADQTQAGNRLALPDFLDQAGSRHHDGKAWQVALQCLDHRLHLLRRDRRGGQQCLHEAGRQPEIQRPGLSTDGIDVPRCSANQRPGPLLGGADAGQLPSVRQQLPVQAGRPGWPQGQGRRVLVVPVAATSPDQAAQDQIHHVRIIGQGGRDRPQAAAQQQPPDGRVLGLHERRGRGGQSIDAVSAWLPVAAGFEPPDHLNPDLQRRSRVAGLGIEQINHPLSSFPSDADRQGRRNCLQPIADWASQRVRRWDRRRRRRSDDEGYPGRPAEGLVEHRRDVFAIEAHRATAAAHHPECFSTAGHRHLNPIGLGPRSPYQAIYLSPILGSRKRRFQSAAVRHRRRLPYQIRPREQITKRPAGKDGHRKTAAMVWTVVREMTALAKRLEVLFGGVGRVMVEMRCGQDDLFYSDRGIVDDVRPRGPVPPVVPPIVVEGVVPTSVPELSDPGAMRPATPLAAAAGALEADRPAEARPFGWIKMAQLLADRHAKLRGISKGFSQANLSAPSGSIYRMNPAVIRNLSLIIEAAASRAGGNRPHLRIQAAPPSRPPSFDVWAVVTGAAVIA